MGPAASQPEGDGAHTPRAPHALLRGTAACHAATANPVGPGELILLPSHTRTGRNGAALERSTQEASETLSGCGGAGKPIAVPSAVCALKRRLWRRLPGDGNRDGPVTPWRAGAGGQRHLSPFADPPARQQTPGRAARGTGARRGLRLPRGLQEGPSSAGTGRRCPPQGPSPRSRACGSARPLARPSRRGRGAAHTSLQFPTPPWETLSRAGPVGDPHAGNRKNKLGPAAVTPRLG